MRFFPHLYPVSTSKDPKQHKVNVNSQQPLTDNREQKLKLHAFTSKDESLNSKSLLMRKERKDKKRTIGYPDKKDI